MTRIGTKKNPPNHWSIHTRTYSYRKYMHTGECHTLAVDVCAAGHARHDYLLSAADNRCKSAVPQRYQHSLFMLLYTTMVNPLLLLLLPLRCASLYSRLKQKKDSCFH